MEQHEKVETAFNTLKRGVQEIMNDPERMRKLFEDYGTYHQYNHYSPHNTLILMFETMFRKGKPFQMARGYRAWMKEYNRQVKKGEKAIYILAPRKVKVKEYDEEQEEYIDKYVHQGFIGVPVFELCQTEGDPIPQDTKNRNYRALQDLKMEEFIKQVNVPIRIEDMINMNGYTDGKTITIGSHNSDLAGICTLFHELAHYNLHYNRDGDRLELYKEASRNLEELEAETVAFIVSSCLGITNEYSMKYIIDWNRDNPELDKEFEDRSYRLLGEAMNQVSMFHNCVDMRC